MQISKEFNNIIRACAIISIALHNLLHTQEMGFVQENEMTFDVNRTNHFFDLLINPDLSIIGDMISFAGWAGVPVFVFLSGYGLAKKYQQRDLCFIQHVKKSYIKLLLLMLPAAFVVIAQLMFAGQYKSVIAKLIALTMLNFFLLKGFVKVEAEMGLYCLSYNLRRAINLKGVPALVANLR